LGFANTGDHNLIQVGQVVMDGAEPVARSAYWEQVRRIAPESLLERERELEELAQFCTAGTSPSYGWWRAEAWAGKTALMAWFALHPPQGVRVVPFFITARLGAQNDRLAYVDVVLEQLAELVGEGLPAHLTGSTREAHLLRLYGEAARTCARRGQRMVLLVDGLDEDRTWTTSPDAHSIASLLPERLEAGMRVLVAGRPNPPVPDDVSARHPLRDPDIVRRIEGSRHAQIIRGEAQRELKVLLADTGLQHDLLGLVTAAGGGLTSSDLAELTGAAPYWVKDAMRSYAGRTFAVREGHVAEVHLLAHEELQAQAEEMLGEDELSRYRQMLHGWATAYAARGWPAGTPEYLLRGYFQMLRADGNLNRMVECALDAVRHNRMLDVTFGDAVASDEIRIAEELTIDAGVPDLLDMIRLAIRRDELNARNDRIGSTLPWAWAALGHIHRAEALARSIPSLDERGMALVRIAEELIERDESGQAIHLLEEAETLLGRADDAWDETEPATARAATAWTLTGRLERAEHLASTVGQWTRRWLLPKLIEMWVHAGAYGQAEAFARREGDSGIRALSMASLLATQAEVGDIEDAHARARAAEPEEAALVLARVGAVLRRSGRHVAAQALFEEAERSLPTSETPVEVIGVLAREGEFDRARNATALLTSPEDPDCAVHELVSARAAAGEHEEAEALAHTIKDSGIRSIALRAVVEELASSRAYEAAQRVADTITAQYEQALAYTAIAHRLANLGDYDQAEVFARRYDDDELHLPMREVVEALAAAGQLVRAEKLAHTLRYDSGYAALARGAVAAAADGHTKQAVECLSAVESELRSAQGPGLMDLVDMAQIMADSGQAEAAITLAKDAEALLPHLETVGSPEFESFRRDIMVASVAEVLASVGEIDRAEALVRQTGGGMGVFRAWQEILRRLVRDGEFDRAEALVDSVDAEAEDVLRADAAVEFAQAGAFDRALALAATVSRPDPRLHAWAGLAAALAAAGNGERARSALAEAGSVLTASPMPLVVSGSLFKACVLVGEDEKAERVLEGVAARADRTPGFCSSLVQALVELEQYDRAEGFVRQITSQGDHGSLQVDLVKAFVAANEYGRAEELTRSIPATSKEAVRCAVSLAPVVEPSRGRVLAARALQSGDLREALPAVLQIEPGAAAIVVESLRRAA
jgi:tetratricopeptide (TPR) repeat protein